MNDSALQRTNMVESQIRPSDVTDRRILRAMMDVPRERFVPEALAALAYMDDAIGLHAPAPPAGSAPRSMMPPRTFAKLLQLAVIEATDAVLVVGAGRGYSAAVIAAMAGRVVALEQDHELAAAATNALSAFPNVAVMTGPLEAGAAGQGPFDAVVIDGAVAVRPDALLGQLKAGGRLVAVLMEGNVGQATVWRRTGNHYGQTSAFDATAGLLPGFGRAHAFVL